jgi:hypothetical protein
MLLEADLEAVEPRILTIHILRDRVAGILRDGRCRGRWKVSCRQAGKAAGGNRCNDLRSGQLLEEESRLNHTEWTQEVFVKQIVVVGMLGP